MIFKIVGGVIVAMVLMHLYKYIRLMEYQKHDLIYTHYPGPCIELQGAEGGSEDLTTLADGLTFISSGMYSHMKGRILLFDFKDPGHKVTELTIDRDMSGFHPQGISVWTEPTSDIVTLMVVNHGNYESVEIFEFTRETTLLKHIKSIPTGNKSFNDVVATGKRTFYATQTVEYDGGGFMSNMELLAMLKIGTVWYYNGEELKLAASGMWGPNGINISPDLQYVYVGEFFNKNILTYKRNTDNTLNLVEKMFIDTNPDSIEVDVKTGDLLIGCHPRMHSIFDYHFKYAGKSFSPSQILKIETENGITTPNITEVFLDNGKLCSASSVASIFKRRIVIGTVASQLLLCDVL